MSRVRRTYCLLYEFIDNLFPIKTSEPNDDDKIPMKILKKKKTKQNPLLLAPNLCYNFLDEFIFSNKRFTCILVHDI